MARLTFKQILIAIAFGAIFAALQGEPPVHLAKATADCTQQVESHC